MNNLIVMYLKNLIRNRSLLILSVIIPVVLYPLIYWGITQYMMVKQGFEDNQQIEVLLKTKSNSKEELFHFKNLTDSLGKIKQVKSLVTKIGNPRKSIIVEISDYKSLPQYTVKLDSTNSLILTSYKYIQPKLKSYFTTCLKEFKAKSNYDEKYYEPYKIETLNNADSNELVTRLLSFIIPLYAIISVLAGASTGAVEVTAGEREINAYETIFVTPLSRNKIHSSKILATFIYSFVSGLINFFMLSAVVIQAMGMFLQQKGVKGSFALDASSIFSFDIIILVIVSIAVIGFLSSMLFVTIASFSPTKKEANVILTPVLSIMMYISFILVIPGIKPSLLISAVPILNVAFTMKLMIANDWQNVFFLQSVLFTLLHIYLIYKFLVPMLFDEDVVFGNNKSSFMKKIKAKFKKKKLPNSL